MVKKTRSGGFVITLEFLLVMALFVIPIILGLIVVGRKLFTLYLSQREFNEQPYSRATVFDSTTPTAKVIGPVMGYDAFEAPLIIFRDKTNSAGVLLGVRRDRFTSYGEVFYTNKECTGAAKIRAYDASLNPTNQERPATASGFHRSPDPPALPTSENYVGFYPPAGFLYQLQGTSYAMGSGNILYRQDPNATEESLTGHGLFVWKSQDVTPYTNIFPLPPDTTRNTDPLEPVPPCFTVPSLTIDNLISAQEVIKFKQIYSAPFRVAFPTPSTTPAPTLCPNAECTPTP